MVQLRRKRLWYVFALLLLVLTILNWFGIRERDNTSIFPFPGAEGVVIGDVDWTYNGSEVVVFSPSHVFAVGGFSQVVQQDTVYYHTDWLTDPIVEVAIGEFDLNVTDQEIIVLTENGNLLLLNKESGAWTLTNLVSLPWSTPVWTTRALACGDLDPVTQGMEIAVVGEKYNWTSLTRTDHVLIANRPDNVSWQVASVYSESGTLLSAAVGDLNTTLSDELVFGGSQASVNVLTGENNTWQVDELFSWSGAAIESLTIGEFSALHPENEIGVAIGGHVFTLHLAGSSWEPRQVWHGDSIAGFMSSVDAGDLDPTHPGDEMLTTCTSVASGLNFYILEPFPRWVGNRPFWFIPALPNDVAVGDFDALHLGAEIVVVTDDDFQVLSNPNFFDRALRVASGVFLPAIILFPAAAVLFAVADRINRVATERRDHYAMEMRAKGYIRCPRCKRFVSKEDMEKHQKAHRSFFY